MKQEVRWMQTLMKVASYGLLYFIKHKNDMHAPAVLQKQTISCLVFELF